MLGRLGHDYLFGMLELAFHDCLRAAAGVPHPAPGSGPALATGGALCRDQALRMAT